MNSPQIQKFFNILMADRMREKLTRVNASIATNVGMTLWQDTQAELAKIRAKK